MFAKAQVYTFKLRRRRRRHFNGPYPWCTVKVVHSIWPIPSWGAVGGHGAAPRDRIRTFICASDWILALEFILLLLLTNSAILEHVWFKTLGDIINTQSYFQKLQTKFFFFTSLINKRVMLFISRQISWVLISHLSIDCSCIGVGKSIRCESSHASIRCNFVSSFRIKK